MDHLREIACAARMRDWSAIDRALDDLALLGRESVMRGFNDARKRRGGEKLPPLDRPNVVTIHDLPSRDGVEIVNEGTEHSPLYKLKPAA